MKNGYYIDFATNTLTITNEFNRRANNPSTPEYATMRQIRNECPNIQVVIRKVRRRRAPHDHLTYDKMVAFIACQREAARLLQEFKTVRTMAGAQSNPYSYVKRWFLATFPNYREIPKLESDEAKVLEKVKSGAA